MKKDFVAVEIELMPFFTDVISTSPTGDDGGFWLPPDIQSYGIDLRL